VLQKGYKSGIQFSFVVKEEQSTRYQLLNYYNSNQQKHNATVIIWVQQVQRCWGVMPTETGIHGQGCTSISKKSNSNYLNLKKNVIFMV
jgi:hypothetical protein